MTETLFKFEVEKLRTLEAKCHYPERFYTEDVTKLRAVLTHSMNQQCGRERVQRNIHEHKKLFPWAEVGRTKYDYWQEIREQAGKIVGQNAVSEATCKASAVLDTKYHYGYEATCKFRACAEMIGLIEMLDLPESKATKYFRDEYLLWLNGYVVWNELRGVPYAYRVDRMCD